ncbi:MAG: hypothetical protein WA799_04080 [Nitrosotalea sp.]
MSSIRPSVSTTPPATSNATKSSSTNPTVTPASITSNQANVNSLIGDGVSLKINGNVASGTIIIAGIRYNAPNLLISKQGSQIQLQGNLQTDDTSMLEAVGVSSSGNEYNFYGVISDNGHSIPVNFAALLTNQVTDKSSTASPQTSTTSSQIPTLPMLMLYTQSQQVTMGYPYNLAVKIFDPKTNPQKIFDQFNGGIPNVNIIGTIASNNQVFTSFSGKTDSQGLYQYQLQTPYYQGWQQTFNVMINASKSGYMPQSVPTSFVTTYPNHGSAPTCSAAIPLTPTAFPAGLNPTPPPTEINLSWNPSTGADSYTIFRGLISGDYNATLGPTSSTTFSDTSVISGKTYYYVIEAANCAGKSSNSTKISQTVP